MVIAIIGLLSTLSVLALNSARARARDVKRLADIKQIQTALEMYYNVANDYPATLASGGTISTSSEIFLKAVPTAPTPTDGDCTQVAGSNIYTYAHSGSGAAASYTLTCCLGSNTAGIPAGVIAATPAGISSQESVSCLPDCIGKECGDDGCGGSCGGCRRGLTCSNNECFACIPDCNEKVCGDDGCGGSCGTCLMRPCRDGRCG